MHTHCFQLLTLLHQPGITHIISHTQIRRITQNHAESRAISQTELRESTTPVQGKPILGLQTSKQILQNLADFHTKIAKMLWMPEHLRGVCQSYVYIWKSKASNTFCVTSCFQLHLIATLICCFVSLRLSNYTTSHFQITVFKKISFLLFGNKSGPSPLFFPKGLFRTYFFNFIFSPY